MPSTRVISAQRVLGAAGSLALLSSLMAIPVAAADSEEVSPEQRRLWTKILEELDEKSEPLTRNEDLHTPGLIKVVGSTAKSVINLDCDVFIKTYRQDCPQCQLWGPIIEQVAEALADVSTIVVGSYDVDKNHVHGLLTLDQTIYTPSLLLWPRNRKAEPVDLSRGHSAHAVITWLHKNTSSWFDLENVLARSDGLIPKTKVKLEKVIRMQLNETPRPADHPCMDPLDDLFIAYQLHQRLDLDDASADAIMQQHMQTYKKCVAEFGAPPLGGDDDKNEKEKSSENEEGAAKSTPATTATPSAEQPHDDTAATASA